MVRKAVDGVCLRKCDNGGKCVKEIRFVNDKCVIASTEKGLQKLI